MVKHMEPDCVTLTGSRTHTKYGSAAFGMAHRSGSFPGRARTHLYVCWSWSEIIVLDTSIGSHHTGAVDVNTQRFCTELRPEFNGNGPRSQTKLSLHKYKYYVWLPELCQRFLEWCQSWGMPEAYRCYLVSTRCAFH